MPRQRLIRENQECRCEGGKRSQRERIARRQGGGRDSHRRDNQEHEGVLNSARKVKERGELKDVECQKCGGELYGQPRARPVTHAQEHIEPGGRRDQRQTEADAEWEA